MSDAADKLRMRPLKFKRVCAKIVESAKFLTVSGFLGIAGCAGPGADNQEYAVVTVSYQFAGSQESARQWRAFMNALDICHVKGYQDAQPASPPERICKRRSGGRCVLFEVTLSYDCIGMGYQTSA